MKLGDIPSALESLPADFRKDDDLLWGDNFQERADAAARTYIRRETAKLVRSLSYFRDSPYQPSDLLRTV